MLTNAQQFEILPNSYYIYPSILRVNNFTSTEYILDKRLTKMRTIF